MMNYDSDKNYVNICGQQFYIDCDEVLNCILYTEGIAGIKDHNTDESLRPAEEPKRKKKEEPKPESSISINLTKWEIINKLIEVVLSGYEEADPAMGEQNLQKLPVGYKLAFNTLLKNNIIKIIDND
jgi:hypothetical protein